jgi:hypothetical protein
MREKEESDLIRVAGDFGPAQSVAVFRRMLPPSRHPFSLLFFIRVFLSCPWIDS